MIERIFRAIRLDVNFTARHADDSSLDTESTLIVILVAMIASLGTFTGRRDHGLFIWARWPTASFWGGSCGRW